MTIKQSLSTPTLGEREKTVTRLTIALRDNIKCLHDEFAVKKVEQDCRTCLFENARGERRERERKRVSRASERAKNMRFSNARANAHQAQK